MKLYATIQAEKLIDSKISIVKKAQGSNTMLDINITNEQKHLLAYIRVIQRINNPPIIYFTCVSSHAQLVDDRGDFDAIESMHTKGNKQKDGYHCIKHAWHCKGDGAYPCPHCK